LTNEFLAAVKKGELEKTKSALMKDPSLINAQDEKGISAVLLAAYHGHRDIAEFLASNKPNMNIFEASTTGKTDRARALINKEPQLVNSYSSDGFTPLHLAAFFGRPETVKMLLEKKAQVNAVAKNSTRVMPLHSALAGGDMPIIEMLVDHGADVNASQQAGYTPLHEAAQSGNLQAAILLLSHGAKINVKADNGKTPLALTMMEGREAGSKEDRERVSEFLRDHGAA
jgi:uncharacterized protein